MSALAAIDTAVKCLDGYWWAVAEADGLEDARAAVAELVEAAKAIRLEASRLMGDCIPADTLADLDAALAAFGESA